jgi:sugar phosphate permease
MERSVRIHQRRITSWRALARNLVFADRRETLKMRDEEHSSTSRAWLVVGLLWVVACLNYLDRLTLASMRDSVKADIAMTDAQFGLLTSVFLWVYGALSPLGGFMADRFGRKAVIVGSLAVWSAVTWLTGQMHSFGGMFMARALMGISEACYIPAGLALIADYHQGRTRSLATGLHMSGVYAGAALGGVGGYIAEHYGWRQGFVWFGLFGLAYALVLLFLLSDREDAPRHGGRAEPRRAGQSSSNVRATEALRVLFSQSAFWALLAYFCLFALANWGINGWLPTYLREQFGLGEGKAGLSATGYIQLASFAGVLLGGWWSDRWARSNPRGRLYVPAIGFCLGGPFLFLMATTNVFMVAITGMLVYGLSRGFSDAGTMPILCQIVSPKYRATGYGFLNLFSTFVGGAMIYAGGALKDANVGLGRIFQFSAIGLVVAALALLLARPRRERKAPEKVAVPPIGEGDPDGLGSLKE